MCGIAGFTGIKSAKTREELVDALGIGIDTRGSHAAGYVSLVGVTAYPLVRMAKTLGTWLASSPRFRHTASVGETCMMHTRFATCGNADNVDHAHPWAIRRGSRTVLYGCHNGVLQGTYTSAAKNERLHTVDSRELLELIADKDYAGIRALDGYGIVTWVVPSSNTVHLLRLSKQSDISCVAVVGGGIVWASTWDILHEALEYAGLEVLGEYTLPDIGTVYALYPDRVEATDVVGLTVGSVWSSWSDHGYLTDDEEIEADILAKADAAEWDGMTSAEWERWGRWVGKRAPEPIYQCKAPYTCYCRECAKPCGCTAGQKCTRCWDIEYRSTLPDWQTTRTATKPEVKKAGNE